MTPTLLCMTRTPLRRVLIEEIVERLVVGAGVVEIREVPRCGNDRELRMRQRADEIGTRADARLRVVLAIDDQDRRSETKQVADAGQLRCRVRDEIVSR